MNVAIGLGSSLGERRRVLERTVRQLGAGTSMEFLRASCWYRTPPLKGGTARNWFLNGVALFETSLGPYEVLERCRILEDTAGRRRGRYWADRPLDLDVLQMGDVLLDDPELTLPHPSIAVRNFVLVPLLEVWPNAVNPRSKRPWSQVIVPPAPRLIRVGVASKPASAYRTHPLEAP